MKSKPWLLRQLLRFRFGLKSILLGVLITCTWLGWVTHSAFQESEAVDTLMSQGVKIDFDDDYRISLRRPFPMWLRPYLPKPFQQMAHKAFSYGNCLPDLSPLGKLRGLQILVLEGKDCEDISVLQGLPLCKVYFHDTAIVDLSPLQSCPTLYVLDMVDTPVTDISPLAGCPQIFGICLLGTEVTDISCLRNTMSLERIRIQDSPVADLCHLKDLRNLSRATFSPNTDPAQIALLESSLPTCDIRVSTEQKYRRADRKR